MIFPLPQRPAESYHEGQLAFGSRRAAGARRHAGCDLYAAKLTPVLAVADGTVTRQSTRFYRPNPKAAWVGALEVWHPGLGKVRYAEIDRAAAGIAIRGKVSSGQVIAYVGQVAGMAHAMLHFEMYAGTADGPLTDKKRPPFERRQDLVDPTTALDLASLAPVAGPLT
jgi:murein DD-endopeptidase MepM/ murein hydrolase activator NlpD